MMMKNKNKIKTKIRTKKTNKYNNLKDFVVICIKRVLMMMKNLTRIIKSNFRRKNSKQKPQMNKVFKIKGKACLNKIFKNNRVVGLKISLLLQKVLKISV